MWQFRGFICLRASEPEDAHRYACSNQPMSKHTELGPQGVGLVNRQGLAMAATSANTRVHRRGFAVGGSLGFLLLGRLRALVVAFEAQGMLALLLALLLLFLPATAALGRGCRWRRGAPAAVAGEDVSKVVATRG